MDSVLRKLFSGEKGFSALAGLTPAGRGGGGERGGGGFASDFGGRLSLTTPLHNLRFKQDKNFVDGVSQNSSHQNGTVHQR